MRYRSRITPGNRGQEAGPPPSGRRDRARVSVLTAGAGVLAAVALTAPAAPDASAASPPAGTQRVAAAQSGMADMATPAPPTTAQCEQLYGFACYQPGQIRTAYNLPALYKRGITGKGMTITIVDPFGSPTIGQDLATFDRQFGYPAPPSFKIITPAGQIPAFDPQNQQMVAAATETTLDVEYAHVVAPGASILLVETPPAPPGDSNIGFPTVAQAEEYVIDHGLGDVVSQSFGAPEERFSSLQQQPLHAAYQNARASDVTVVSATGDFGATVPLNGSFDPDPGVLWPASDPLVTAVGATQLQQDGRRYTSVAWNDTDNTAVNQHFFGDAGPHPIATGGGTSQSFARPAYQDGVTSVTGAQRGLPDISMNGACSSSVMEYASFGGTQPGWQLDCGASESAPLFSGIVALADQVAGHSLGLINRRLYALYARHAPGIVDVTSGNNTVTFPGPGGTPLTVQGYPATKGYDLVSGVGTINALPFVYELAGHQADR
jgi:subtilase family serine protease